MEFHCLDSKDIAISMLVIMEISWKLNAKAGNGVNEKRRRGL